MSRIQFLVRCLELLFCAAGSSQLLRMRVIPGSQETIAEQSATDQQASLDDGFSVSAEIILLRSQSVESEPHRSVEAIEKLGRNAMDRVTVEILKSLARIPDEVRRHAAAKALIEIGERAAELGYRDFAGMIGEDVYLSSHAIDLRKRAHTLFMLLDTERAIRHREFR